MKTVVLKNILENTSSNSEGLKLYNVLMNCVKENEKLILAVDNDLTLSSSFLNSSIGAFLESEGLSKFKKIFKFRGSKSQYKRITEYISQYSELFLVK